MKKLVIITKKPLMVFISLIAVIGLILSCAEEMYNPGIQPPVIAEIGPDAAFEGSDVIIFGANFSSAAASNTVSFNGIAATVTATTTSEITTTVPIGATTGEVTVATNSLTSAGFPFTVKIPVIATLTALEPDSAEIGDTVTITGSNFSATPGDNIVSFAGGIATVISSTETVITTTVPATASTGDVTVTRDRASNGLEFTVTTPIFYVTVQITEDTDDAEEGGNNGVMTNTSSDLELGEYDTWTQDGVEQGLQTIGLRFNAIDIPAGSKILAASIQFTADNTGADPVQLTIYGEANSNPITFTNDDDLNPYDITTRARTVANAVWDVPPWPDTGDAGPDQETVDFASVIQEIIDRADWASGNSMVIIMDHSGPSIGVTSSSGGREAEAGPGSDAPTLKIIYQ